MMQIAGMLFITWYIYQAYAYTARYDRFCYILGRKPSLTIVQRVIAGLLWPVTWWKMRKLTK